MVLVVSSFRAGFLVLSGGLTKLATVLEEPRDYYDHVIVFYLKPCRDLDTKSVFVYLGQRLTLYKVSL